METQKEGGLAQALRESEINTPSESNIGDQNSGTPVVTLANLFNAPESTTNGSSPQRNTTKMRVIVSKPTLSPSVEVGTEDSEKNKIDLTNQREYSVFVLGQVLDRQWGPYQSRFLFARRVYQISFGLSHCVWSTKEGIWSVGNNAHGQCGQLGCEPIIRGTLIPSFVGKFCRKLECGDFFTVILDDESRLWGFGDNSNGALGLGDRTAVNEPTLIPLDAIGTDTVVSFSCAAVHTIFLTASGAAFSSGCAPYIGLGERIQKISRFTRVVSLNQYKIRKVFCSRVKSIFITEELYVFACGSINDVGQRMKHYMNLGVFDDLEYYACIERTIYHPCNIGFCAIEAALGEKFVTLLSPEGQVFSWGRAVRLENTNVPQRLNRTYVKACSSPTIIESLSKIKIVVIAAGDEHSAALSDKNRLFVWGNNDYNQLADSAKVVFRPKEVGIFGDRVAHILCGNKCTVVVCESDIDNLDSENLIEFSSSDDNSGQTSNHMKLLRTACARAKLNTDEKIVLRDALLTYPSLRDRQRAFMQELYWARKWVGSGVIVSKYLLEFGFTAGRCPRFTSLTDKITLRLDSKSVVSMDLSKRKLPFLIRGVVTPQLRLAAVPSRGFVVKNEIAVTINVLLTSNGPISQMFHMDCGDGTRHFFVFRVDPESGGEDVPREIRFGDLSHLTQIGRGASGTVYQAEWQSFKVAYKMYDLPARLLVDHSVRPADLDEALKDFRTEVQILSTCSHPHIIKIYGVILEPAHIGVVMEYMSHSSLDVMLSRIRKNVPLSCKILLEIVSALVELHTKLRVVHRDLKPGNVFVCSTEFSDPVHIKIGDMGCVVATSIQQKTVRAGTVGYMAPEILRGSQQYDESADIYCWGLIAYEMVTGMILRSRTKGIMDIVEHASSYRTNLSKEDEEDIDTMMKCKDWPQDLRNACRQSLSLDPLKRPTATELYKRLMEVCNTFDPTSAVMGLSPNSDSSDSGRSYNFTNYSNEFSSLNSWVINTPMRDYKAVAESDQGSLMSEREDVVQIGSLANSTPRKGAMIIHNDGGQFFEFDGEFEEGIKGIMLRTLKKLGLEEWYPKFVEQQIDDEAFLMLKREDLKEAGMALGHRVKLEHALNHIQMSRNNLESLVP